MNRVGFLTILALAIACGCGKGSNQTEIANVTSGEIAPSNSVDKNGATRTSAPSKGIPSGGIALEPKDPNNPIYKADPRLQGGG